MDDIYFSRLPHALGHSWGADIDQFFSSPFFTSCGQRLKNHSGISWNGNRIWSVKCLGLSADLGSRVGEGREEGPHVWERKAVRRWEVRVQKEFLPRIIVEVLIYAMSHIQTSSSSFIIKFWAFGLWNASLFWRTHLLGGVCSKIC